jgi:O-antigen ligase
MTTEREHTTARIGRWGLYLFAASLPISHVPAQLGAAVALIAWLAGGIVHRRPNLRWPPVLVPFALYVLWSLVGAACSARPAHSLAAVVDNEWPVVMALLIYWVVRDAATLTRLVWLFIGSAGAAAIYALWQFTGGVELLRGLKLDPHGDFYRSVGFYSFYLSYAAVAMSALCLAGAWVLERRTHRLWASLLAALNLAAVGVTLARSIWLGLAVVVPMGLVSRGRRTALVAGAVVLVLVAGLLLGSATVRERVASIGDLSLQETRFGLWQTALLMAGDHLWLGIGQDNWDHHFEDYRVPGFYNAIDHPHNDYLSALVFSGLPGLALFLVVWGMVVWRGVAAWRRAGDRRLRAVLLGATLAIIGLLAGGLFQNYYGTFVNALDRWFLVGLLLAAGRLAARGSPAT